MPAEEGVMKTNEQSSEFTRWKAVVSGLTLLLLSPVIGMVFVFVLLPALPIVLGIGAVLGPMTLLRNVVPHEDLTPADWDVRHAMALEAHA
jgi:hypothetical protein